MDRPEKPHDEETGAASAVPGLIHDYRAQREAWREQARNLARMREEVLSAADREARDIVTAARGDVRRILLKARRDLLVLAAQVRAAGRLGEAEDAPDTGPFLPADDLGQARDVLSSARHDVRRVLDESRPELEGLAAEGEALRAALRGQKPAPSAELPKPVAQRRLEEAIRPAQRRREEPIAVTQPPVDVEFTSVASEPDDEEENAIRRRFRTMTVAAAALGALALIGTVSWLYRPGTPETSSTASVATPTANGTPSTSVSPSKTGGPTASAASPTVAVRPRTASPNGSLSLNIAATRTAWIRITTDGRIAAERLFKAGETHQVRGARDVSVRAGDAGAVTVAVDDGRPQVMGREGEVVTRRFAVDAPRVPPAPAATPTRQTPIQAANPAPASPVPQRAQQPAPAVVSTPAAVASAAPPRVNPQPQIQPSVPAPPPAAAPVLQAAPSAAARPTTAPVERPSAPPVAAAPAPTSTPVSLQESLAGAATRWLDAYYRQDRASMNAVSGVQANVVDDRPERERLPRGSIAVQRSLDDVRLNVFGTDAILTARMTERTEDAAAGRSAQVVSFVSHMWTQRNGVWQLHDVRIVSASALNRAAQR